MQLFKSEEVKYRLRVVEIAVMVKQFTLCLCGLLKKSNLSLVSVDFMVLQVTSGSLGEDGAYLVELLYVVDMRCCLTLV